MSGRAITNAAMPLPSRTAFTNRGSTTGMYRLAKSSISASSSGAYASPGERRSLSESAAPVNGLLTAHYPVEFELTPLGSSTLVLARHLDDGSAETVTLVAADAPAAGDLDEFARVVDLAGTRAFTRDEPPPRTPGACNGHPGLVSRGTWPPLDGGARLARRACHFLCRGRGYSFVYSLPEALADADEPVLREIVDAVDLRP